MGYRVKIKAKRVRVVLRGYAVPSERLKPSRERLALGGGWEEAYRVR
jgi:hypothetical protein